MPQPPKLFDNQTVFLRKQKLVDEYSELWRLVQQQHEVVQLQLESVSAIDDNSCTNGRHEDTEQDIANALDGDNGDVLKPRLEGAEVTAAFQEESHEDGATAFVAQGSLITEPGKVLCQKINTDTSSCPERTSSSGFAHAAKNHWMKAVHKKAGFLVGKPEANTSSWVAETSAFKYSVMFLIIANSSFVGFEMQMSMTRALDGEASLSDSSQDRVNDVFAILFSLELAIRISAYRLHFFLGEDWAWNMFDFAIVAFALAEYVLAGVNGLSALRALRVLRLARTLRIIRVVAIFRNLQLILMSLINSLLSLVWMLTLLTLALYLVTIVFMGGASSFIHDGEVDEPAVYGPDDLTWQQTREAFERDWCTIPRGMLSMFFAVTGGVDWYVTVRPLMNASWVYAIVFVAFEVFVVFGIFNVLNAVFVESVITNRDKDLLIQSEQYKTKIFMRDLADLFFEGDTDNDNVLSLDELKSIVETHASALT